MFFIYRILEKHDVNDDGELDKKNTMKGKRKNLNIDEVDDNEAMSVMFTNLDYKTDLQFRNRLRRRYGLVYPNLDLIDKAKDYVGESNDVDLDAL